MTTIATFADKAKEARAAVAKAEHEAATMEALALGWPTDRAVSFAVDVGGHIAVKAQAADRAAAAAYLEAFELEPLAYVKGTFTTVKPLAWFKDSELETARESITADLMPAVWNYGHGKAELRAWPRIAGGGRVQLTVEIAQDPARQHTEYDRPERRDRRVTRDQLDGAPNGEGIRWSGGDGKPRTFTVYFYQEPGGGAPTLADLLAIRGRAI